MAGHARHEGLLAELHNGGVDVSDCGDRLDGRDVERLRVGGLGLLGGLVERREPSDDVPNFVQGQGVHRRHAGDGSGDGLDVLAGYAPAITGDIDVDVVFLVLDQGADQGPTVGEVEVDGAVTGDDDGAGVHDGLQEVTTVTALGDTSEVRTRFATSRMRIIRRAVTTEALSGRQGGEQGEAVLGVAAFERGQPLGELIGPTGDGLLRGGQGFLHGRLGALGGGFEEFDSRRRDALGGSQRLEVRDEECVDTRSRQLGEGLPGALTAGGGALAGCRGEFDETLGRIQLGERADGDHGDFVLLVLGILAGDVGEIGRLALEPELEGLGASRTAEFGVGDQTGEQVVGERGDLELILFDEFERGTEDVGLALQQGRQSRAQAGAQFLGVTGRERCPMAGRLVDGIRVGPEGEETESLGPGFGRELLVGGDGHHAGGVRFATETEGAMRQATQHEGRPFAGAEVVDERGDGRSAGFESEVMHGADGFVGDERRLVLHEAGSGRVQTATQGDDRGEAHGSAVVLGDGIEGGGGLAEVVDGEGSGVTDDRVGVGVLLEHREDLREELVSAETGRGDGGKGTHAGRWVEDQLAERELVTLERSFFEGPHSLSADFGVGMSEQRDETPGRGGAVFQRGDRGRALPGGARGDGRATAGEDTETPDAVHAFEGVRRLGGG